MLDVFFRAVFLLDEVVKRAEAGDVDDRAAGLEPLKSLLLVDQELRILIEAGLLHVLSGFAHWISLQLVHSLPD